MAAQVNVKTPPLTVDSVVQAIKVLQNTCNSNISLSADLQDKLEQLQKAMVTAALEKSDVKEFQRRQANELAILESQLSSTINTILHAK